MLGLSVVKINFVNDVAEMNAHKVRLFCLNAYNVHKIIFCSAR